MRNIAWLAVLSTLLIGCKPKPEEKAEPAQPDAKAEPATDRCTTQADALAKSLAEWESMGIAIFAFPGFGVQSGGALKNLPVDKSARPLEARMPILHVTGDWITFEGQEMAKREELASSVPVALKDRLAQVLKRINEAKQPARMYIAISPALSEAERANLAKAAEGYELRRVVATGKPLPAFRTSTPAFEKFLTDLENIGKADGKAKLLPTEPPAPLECKEVGAVFKEIASATTSKGKLFKKLPAAMKSCGCKGLDLDLFPGKMENLARPETRYGWLPW